MCLRLSKQLTVTIENRFSELKEIPLSIQIRHEMSKCFALRLLQYLMEWISVDDKLLFGIHFHSIA